MGIGSELPSGAFYGPSPPIHDVAPMPHPAPLDLHSSPALTHLNLAEKEVINAEVFGSLRAECPDLVEHLVTLFFEAAKPVVAHMKRIAVEGDATALFAGAHQLKGSASNFGADRFILVCEEIERISETGAPHATQQELVAAMVSELAAIEQALAS